MNPIIRNPGELLKRNRPFGPNSVDTAEFQALEQEIR